MKIKNNILIFLIIMRHIRLDGEIVRYKVRVVYMFVLLPGQASQMWERVEVWPAPPCQFVYKYCGSDSDRTSSTVSSPSP